MQYLIYAHGYRHRRPFTAGAFLAIGGSLHFFKRDIRVVSSSRSCLMAFWSASGKETELDSSEAARSTWSISVYGSHVEEACCGGALFKGAVDYIRNLFVSSWSVRISKEEQPYLPDHAQAVPYRLAY